MTHKKIRIGTRESQLALWQATLVHDLLAGHGVEAELVPIKSDGDIDLKTPLYEMGVQGIFTRSLDAALLQQRIDIAVHSMKDVPTQLPAGIVQAAVLRRGPVHDLLVFKTDGQFLSHPERGARIATSSIRRKAQWLHRYPGHQIDNLRGNVNTRLRKLAEEPWDGAIFALAGLERINLRPAGSLILDWMLPAPAQGAILVVCRQGDGLALEACQPIHDADTELCTRIERDFLRGLSGGCSTPISALAEIERDELIFRGHILSVDGVQKFEVEKILPVEMAHQTGLAAAGELLSTGAKHLVERMQHAGK